MLTSNSGPVLSILVIFIVLYVATFPASSLTFITIPDVFSVYVFIFSSCHVIPPSKLYVVFCNPLSVSSAVIVNVTFSFVHFSGVCVTFIVGAVVSCIVVVEYFV